MRTSHLRISALSYKSNRLIRLATTVGLTVVSVGPMTSAATVLTFTNETGRVANSDDFVPQNYGDNVSSSPQGEYTYGLMGSDFTPNVTVDYVGGQIYDTDYGDLGVVLYDLNSITFTAEDGFLVSLDSFKAAGYFQADESFTFTISNGTDQFTYTNVSAPGVGHNLIDFASQPAATGQVVTVTFEPTGGVVGFSEFQFSQIPEPSALLLCAVAGIGLVLRRRRIK